MDTDVNRQSFLHIQFSKQQTTRTTAETSSKLKVGGNKTDRDPVVGHFSCKLVKQSLLEGNLQKSTEKNVQNRSSLWTRRFAQKGPLSL